MKASTFSRTTVQKSSPSNYRRSNSSKRRQNSARKPENSDVLISAVISPCLLTHLHHLLQSAENGALKAGHQSTAANFAQLRKVLCMDARSMEDALAAGIPDADLGNSFENQFKSNAA